MDPATWYAIIMAVVSMVASEKAQSQQAKHQKKIQDAQARKAEQEKQKAIRDEKEALKKRQASMRAKMGAGGTGFGGGSASAVLGGMQKQTTQNLLDINSGFKMNQEIGQLNATDGVSNGLKNIQKGIGYANTAVNIAGKENFNNAFKSKPLKPDVSTTATANQTSTHPGMG